MYQMKDCLFVFSLIYIDIKKMSQLLLSPSGVNDYIRVLSAHNYSQNMVRNQLLKFNIKKIQSQIRRIMIFKTKTS